MKHFCTLLAAALLLAVPAAAQSFNQTRSLAQSDLREAEQELAALREQIADEKIPLAARLTELETEVLAKRREAERNRRIVDNRGTDLNQLEDRVAKLRENNTYLSTLLSDYVNRFRAAVQSAEVQLYDGEIEEAVNAAEELSIEDPKRFAQQTDVVNLALNRLEDVIGGRTFEGDAKVPGGEIKPGDFAVMGPLAYYASNDGTNTGVAAGVSGTIVASINPTAPIYAEGITSLVRNGEGTVPFDSTLGDAFKIELTKDTILDEFRKGGMVMYPIWGLAIVGLLLALYKWFEIGSVRQARRQDLEKILDLLGDGKKDEARSYADGIKGPSGEMLREGVEYWEEDKEIIEEVLYEKIINTQPKLDRFVPLIAVIAATAPLLGLLGTVTGMIKTFKLITVFGTGDAQSLSTGISEALLTTKYGLIIAIPAIILHAILNRKAKGVVASMEQTAVGFINGVSEIKTKNKNAA